MDTDFKRYMRCLNHPSGFIYGHSSMNWKDGFLSYKDKTISHLSGDYLTSPEGEAYCLGVVSAHYVFEGTA